MRSAPTVLTRRKILVSGASFATAGLVPIRVGFSATPGHRKLVLVILRGALDGLAAVAPIGDRNYDAVRGPLSLSADDRGDQPLPVGDGFVLHPALQTLAGLYRDGQVAIVHAVATPYRSRSHFDAQDVLETGGDTVFGVSDGWLNRSLDALARQTGKQLSGLGIGPALPLVLRGPAETTTWAPAVMPTVDDDTTQRLMDLYAKDPLLGPALAEAIATDDLLGSDGMRARGRTAQQPATLMTAAAKLLTAEGGADVAVVSLDGWDTHANQGARTGSLANKLAGLDEGLAALKQALGPSWRDTAVIVATEFGRTVSVNGTRGTDHGTGGVAFILGGAVRGGRFHGGWPGLAQAALFQGRDLAPTNDLRSVFKGVLMGLWGLDSRVLAQDVFPNSADARPMTSLVA